MVFSQTSIKLIIEVSFSLPYLQLMKFFVTLLLCLFVCKIEAQSLKLGSGQINDWEIGISHKSYKFQYEVKGSYRDMSQTFYDKAYLGTVNVLYELHKNNKKNILLLTGVGVPFILKEDNSFEYWRLDFYFDWLPLNLEFVVDKNISFCLGTTIRYVNVESFRIYGAVKFTI